MGAPNDAVLLERCRRGDEEAWRLLVERYAALILSIPRRYGLRSSQADDVFGDVCVALVRSLSQIRDPQSLPMWLIRTATRATWENSRRTPLQVPEGLPELTGGAPPEEFALRIEEEQMVRQALDQIPERCRNLLRLLYFAAPPLNYDEVAERLGMPRGSLGPTRQRCLDKMRGFLPPGFGGGVSGEASGPS